MAIRLEGMVGNRMTNRQMFSKDIVEKILPLPLTSQTLFFHLGVMANKKGFVSCPGAVLRYTGCSVGDLTALTETGLVELVEDGLFIKTC